LRSCRDKARHLLAPEDLRRHVRELKRAVAVPKMIEIGASLPLTAIGKVDKRALRSQHAV
jgi:fatty-acyl-CoA synthase